GNYTAALLITTACEVLGTLRYGRKDGGQEFFSNYLLPKPWRAVSQSIYDALRNGLAHSFSTKIVINASDKPIELGVSWSKEKHFGYDSGNSVLFLNVQQLAIDLRSAFDRYQSELQQSAEFRNTFHAWREKKRIYQVRNESERANWSALLKRGRS
ncbi:MAG: hypothetical protein MN733_08155, partial [Nitrososphaera sp.]|nr:hypothetical protein [Nitrososphaera sp.]